MKVIVHIGTSKTGSTFLQAILDLNRRAPVERGLLFPEKGLSLSPDGRRDRSSGHYFLIRAIRQGDSKVFDELRKEVDGHDVEKILLSCENFSMHPEVVQVQPLGLVA